MSDDEQGFGTSEESPHDAFDWAEFESVEEEEEGEDVLRFEIGGRGFAVLAAQVAEVSAPTEVVPIPGVPPYVRGVAVRRQTVVTVLDLSHFLELGLAVSPQTRFVVMKVKDLDVAILVDGVSGLELWPNDDESTKLLSDVDERIREFAVGARWAPGGVVVLLDAARILERASIR